MSTPPLLLPAVSPQTVTLWKKKVAAGQLTVDAVNAAVRSYRTALQAHFTTLLSGAEVMNCSGNQCQRMVVVSSSRPFHAEP